MEEDYIIWIQQPREGRKKLSEPFLNRRDRKDLQKQNFFLTFEDLILQSKASTKVLVLQTSPTTASRYNNLIWPIRFLKH